MRLKGNLARFMLVGGLAVMTSGLSQAGGCSGCCWCGSPAPKTAQTLTTTAHHSIFSSFWSFLTDLL